MYIVNQYSARDSEIIYKNEVNIIGFCRKIEISKKSYDVQEKDSEISKNEVNIVGFFRKIEI